jgi:GNAT superfamily N-acetyltransferase
MRKDRREAPPMETRIRDATAADAPFLAWVIQTAARSHLKLGVWDLAFPGADEPRLEKLAAIASSDSVHLCHWSRFRVLEVAGEPAAALSAYENSQHGTAQLTPALFQASLGFGPGEMKAVGEGIAPFISTGYPNPDGVWIIEWVATRPEHRGQGLIHRLLLDILDRGRQQSFEIAQVGSLLGNTPAKNAYEKVGFKRLDEWCHADFEVAFGTPGAARMQRPL